MRRAVTWMLPLALLGVTAPAASARVLHEYRASDRIVYVIGVANTLERSGGARLAAFDYVVNPPGDPSKPYAVGGPLFASKEKLAGRRAPLRMRTVLNCQGRGVEMLAGTTVRGARRVVARFPGGRRVRLARRRPPKRWRYSGWVIGQVVPSRTGALDVTAYGRGGRVLGTATLRNSTSSC